MVPRPRAAASSIMWVVTMLVDLPHVLVVVGPFPTHRVVVTDDQRKGRGEMTGRHGQLPVCRGLLPKHQNPAVADYLQAVGGQPASLQHASSSRFRPLPDIELPNGITFPCQLQKIHDNLRQLFLKNFDSSRRLRYPLIFWSPVDHTCFPCVCGPVLRHDPGERVRQVRGPTPL